MSRTGMLMSHVPVRYMEMSAEEGNLAHWYFFKLLFLKCFVCFWHVLAQRLQVLGSNVDIYSLFSSLKFQLIRGKRSGWVSAKLSEWADGQKEGREPISKLTGRERTISPLTGCSARRRCSSN